MRATCYKIGHCKNWMQAEKDCNSSYGFLYKANHETFDAMRNLVRNTGKYVMVGKKELFIIIMMINNRCIPSVTLGSVISKPYAELYVGFKLTSSFYNQSLITSRP